MSGNWMGELSVLFSYTGTVLRPSASKTMLVEPGDVICVLDEEMIIPHDIVELGYCGASFSKEAGW